MKITTLILVLISFNFCFSQERTNNINEKNPTEKIQLIKKDIDELKHQRESILADKKILTEEEKRQIEKIDEKIKFREEKIKNSINEIKSNEN
jgi:hypothetical protein